MCLHRVIYQNKCLWFPVDGWPLETLWSPLSHHVVEIEDTHGKSLQGSWWLNNCFFNPLSMEKHFYFFFFPPQNQPSSYLCTFALFHLGNTLYIHSLRLYFISMSSGPAFFKLKESECPAQGHNFSKFWKEYLQIYFLSLEFPSWFEKFKIAAFWSKAVLSCHHHLKLNE